MSERKVLNKYYPPDFDPSKIPRMKLAKNRQYTVRLMAPFNMRCATCGEYIYKGKKFNARKEDVENEDYLGIRIYRFYIKCTRCLQEISFKTDPKNTDYEIEAGATRNFMALKLAEEQAKREEEEQKEEEANNPMKLLEYRTEQSRQEIELLESLEELKELNRRQRTVDYEGMLKQYQPETVEERKAREEKEDNEFIKSIKFGSSSNKVVAEEIIEEVQEDNGPPAKTSRIEVIAPVVAKNKGTESKKNESWNRSIGVLSKKPALGNLVRKKPEAAASKPQEENTVCEDHNCQEEVFPLAISYLDRFLSVCAVGKSQVQLLGTACLLLASKLREPSSRCLPAELLIFYTANSITLADLCSWELLVLSKLKWDVAGVTAHDFLPLLLSRLPLRGLVNTEMVQRHAQTFIALAARDYQFTLYSASTLAACSIAAALRGLALDGHLARLQELTRIDLDCLQTCLEQIEEMVDNMIEERAIAVPNGQSREAAGWTPPPSQDKAHSNAATPTDVRDVHF